MEDYNGKFPEGKVIAQFSAEWCGPCRVLKPRMEKLVDGSDAVTGVLVNVDEYPATSEDFSIRSIPTVVIMEDREEVARYTGSGAFEAVKQYISEQ